MGRDPPHVAPRRHGRSAPAGPVRPHARREELPERHAVHPAAEFALFDVRLHFDFDPAKDTVLELLGRVRREVAVVLPPAYNRFPNQFAHIFASGYAAGYYSYKWAEVLSADAYSAFEEGGVLSPDVGSRFRREVLAAGGSRPALESFVAFRGRKPEIDALLRHNGMTSTA
jgi:oligopeptidase A